LHDCTQRNVATLAQYNANISITLVERDEMKEVIQEVAFYES
jgi:hypothetical protein